MAKQSMKRIHSITLKRVLDESPDTSWLGEYSNRRTSEFSIDRRHVLDCPVNSGREGKLLWYTSGSGRIEFEMTWEDAQSVSHSGPCDSDVEELLKNETIQNQLFKINPSVLREELKEYGAWDMEELADHEQNLQRLLWIAGGDITDNDGCQCGESGDMGRYEYRYFNPSFNYVDEAGRALPENTPEDVRKNVLQDYNRMEALNRGDWCFVGVRAEAELLLGVILVQTVTSGGIWGIESDSDANCFAEIEGEQLAELREQLEALGFSKRAISAALRNVEHKTGRA